MPKKQAQPSFHRLRNPSGGDILRQLYNLLEADMIDKRQFYINGQWVSPAKANNFDIIDPSTEDVVGVISLGGQSDTDAAVAAAKEAFPAWSQTSKEERLVLLDKLLEIYKARQAEMAAAISLG